MDKTGKIAIVGVLAVLIGMVVFLKQNRGTSESSQATSQPTTQSVGKASLPQLIELGSTSCIPCKMMEPVLEELRTEYAGRLDVQFIDINKYGSQAEKYNIRIIPTQVFFNGKGEEIFRHEGFFSKARILDKFKENGILLEKGKGNEESK
jgi:thioredoxin 1